MNRFLHASTVAVILVLAFSLWGCDAGTEPATETDDVLGVEEPVATHDALPEAERVVGMTDLGDGRVRVVGLLQYRADLDGAWLIVEGTPGEEPSPEATVIAWIENMYDLDSACSTKGALVYAEGTLAEDDGSGPGPALTAEFVARADEPE